MIIAVYLVILVAAFFFLIVLPQRRRMAAHQVLMASLERGDEVITTGGIYGTIRDLDDATVQLVVAPELTITVARGAIAQKIHPELDPPDLDSAELDPPDLDRVEDDFDGEAR
jgi:preprotein translocase subunit YajC